MARKGEQKAQKSLSAKKILPLQRKEKKFVEKTRAGPYKKTEGIPLRFALKNIIGIANTTKEADSIIAKGKVKVNNKIVRRKTLTVGLFDLIELNGLSTSFRIKITKKGTLTAKKEKEKKTGKIVKIKNKKTGKKGKTFITTSDGKTIQIKKEKVFPGDSIVLKLPGQKIEKILPMQKKAKALVTGGKHAGETAEIIKIKKGSMTREKLVNLKSEKGKFETTEKHVLVTG